GTPSATPRLRARAFAAPAAELRGPGAPVGSVRLGSVRLGSVRLGSVRLGSGRLGSVRPGSGRDLVAGAVLPVQHDPGRLHAPGPVPGDLDGLVPGLVPPERSAGLLDLPPAGPRNDVEFRASHL